MIDFTSALANELAQVHRAQREREAAGQRLGHQFRAASPGPSVATRVRRFFGHGPERRRREYFANALDAAQREGITIDAWFGFKFADPALSARAEWAGLNDAVEIQDRRRPHAA